MGLEPSLDCLYVHTRTHSGIGNNSLWTLFLHCGQFGIHRFWSLCDTWLIQEKGGGKGTIWKKSGCQERELELCWGNRRFLRFKCESSGAQLDSPLKCTWADTNALADWGRADSFTVLKGCKLFESVHSSGRLQEKETKNVKIKCGGVRGINSGLHIVGGPSL